MTNLLKERVETNLLDAMKNIDAALSIIYDEPLHDKNAQELSKAKASIKKILNKDYDYCARNRAKA